MTGWSFDYKFDAGQCSGATVTGGRDGTSSWGVQLLSWMCTRTSVMNHECHDYVQITIDLVLTNIIVRDVCSKDVCELTLDSWWKKKIWNCIVFSQFVSYPLFFRAHCTGLFNRNLSLELLETHDCSHKQFIFLDPSLIGSLHLVGARYTTYCISRTH